MNDTLTVSMIKKFELREGYWHSSEKHILNIVKRYIRELVKNNNSKMLDAGCGIGRLIPIFEKYFSEVYAIEPDIDRIEDAKKMIDFYGLQNKVAFINHSAEDVSSMEKVDAIICSHIIQHVGVKTAEDIIRKFGESLKDEGLLFIMTCYSDREEDYFMQDYLLNGEFVEKDINRDRFEELVCGIGEVLPVHFFTKQTITNMLVQQKLEVIDLRKYHKLKGRQGFRDVLIVAKKRLG